MSLTVWVSFVAGILCLLAIDLLAARRRPHDLSFREAVAWSVGWVSLGMVFAAVLWRWLGAHASLEYLAGYVIELSLSVDNLFVFAVLFSAFGVPQRHRRTVLFWGIVGAIALRLTFILVGVALIEAFHATIYLFGLILLWAGWKMMQHDALEIDPAQNRLLMFLRRHLPITESYREGKFVVHEGGRWFATPLLLVLILIEASDVMFAIDSIPAVFAVTRDPFVAFSANAFAVLGLRSLFFVTIGALDRFVYLNRGVAAVLVFVALKMLLSDVFKIPTPYALAGVALILGVAIVASILRPQPLGNGKAGASLES